GSPNSGWLGALEGSTKRLATHTDQLAARTRPLMARTEPLALRTSSTHAPARDTHAPNLGTHRPNFGTHNGAMDPPPADPCPPASVAIPLRRPLRFPRDPRAVGGVADAGLDRERDHLGHVVRVRGDDRGGELAQERRARLYDEERLAVALDRAVPPIEARHA